MGKLTLSMDPKDIQAAHRLAKRHGTSVSNMFSRLVRAMSRRTPDDEELPPITRELSGIISWPKGKTERQLIEEALLEKYGLGK
jgi:hypothetical protein